MMMRTSVRPITLFFCSAFILVMTCLTAYAEKNSEVEVEGYATIVDGRKDTAREQAIQNAFRRAVEQAVGVMVQSETLVRNFELLKDKVYSQSRGYIKKYSITGEKLEGDAFRVRISAVVSTVKLHKVLDEIGLIMKKVGKPRIMLLLSEQNILDDRPSPTWSVGNVGTGVAENTLLSRFMEKGFNMVDRQVVIKALKDDPTLRNLSSDISNDAAMKIASEGEAEVVIIGQAVAKAGSPLMGTTIRSCQATISARALNVDIGEPIATVTTNAVAPNVNSITGGSEALKKASLEMADKLIAEIIAKWKKKAEGEYRVKLVVRGLGFARVKDFREFLRTAVDDIEEIYDRGFKDGVAKLDIEVGMSAREVAESLSGRKFGKSSLEVTAISNNVVEINVRSR